MKNKVLIIEDDQFTREMYARQFEKSGYQVITAEDGTEGLQAIFTQKPNFVLLDIMLPKMDGVTLLDKAREREQEASSQPVPVIILTNLGQESILDRCLELGITGFIIKARFTPSEVVERTKELLA